MIYVLLFYYSLWEALNIGKLFSDRVKNITFTLVFLIVQNGGYDFWKFNTKKKEK